MTFKRIHPVRHDVIRNTSTRKRESAARACVPPGHGRKAPPGRATAVSSCAPLREDARRGTFAAHILRPALLLALALAVPGYAAAESTGSRIAMLDYEAPVPGEWIAETPTSSMRLHQYRLPGDSETLAGHLVVYFFGITQGGSIDANIDRWRSQFSNSEGAAVEPIVKRFQVENLPVTTAEFRGDYRRGVGMGPAGEALKDHVLIAAIVETPKGNLFVQLYGPAQTVDRHRAAYAHFLNNIAPTGN